MSLTEFLTSIADAIRSKMGTSDSIPASEFADRIKAIETGVDTSDATATESDLLYGKTAYVGGEKISGNIESKSASNVIITGSAVNVEAGYYDASVNKSVKTVTQAVPSIEVSSDGLITATASQNEGYVSAGTSSSTKQLSTKTSSDLSVDGAKVTVPAGYYPNTVTKTLTTATQATPTITVNSSGLITATSTQPEGYVTAGTTTATDQMTTKAATTWTPSTADQTISAGTYLTGVQTIKGDANLVASNIAKDVPIFGVTGTYSATQPEVSVYVYNNTPYTNYVACSAGFVSISSRGGSVTVTCRKNEPFFILMRSSNYSITDTSNSLNSTFGFLGDSRLYQTIYSDMAFGCVLLDDCSFEIS